MEADPDTPGSIHWLHWENCLNDLHCRAVTGPFVRYISGNMSHHVRSLAGLNQRARSERAVSPPPYTGNGEMALESN